jgi:ankyrin repeat protein
LNKTLLQFAAEHKRTGAVELIQQMLNERLWIYVIENGINNMPNENVMVEIKQLINYGAQINHKHTDKNYQEWTVLHLACQKTNKTFVQFLIEQMKADYLIPNGSGNYPIAITAEHGNLAILKYLWKLPESNLNVTNKDNETPLHLATKNRHLLIVRFLIQWGADSQAQDFKKRTALDIAKMNVSNNRQDELNAKKLLSFLEQLICPSIENSKNRSETASKKPNIDQDTCELVMAIPIKPIQIGDTDPTKKGIKSLGILVGTPNDNLHDAVRKGFASAANQAIGEGADICYRKNGFTPHQIALETAHECYAKLQSSNIKLSDRLNLQEKMQWCQHIANTISQIALTKMIEAIEQSNTGLVVAYHIAGAPLTSELLYCTCSSSDNVEIVHYLIQQSKEIFQSVYKYSRPESPYKTAKRKEFYRVASYLKYVLSIECTQAIKENNLSYVEQLVLSGASVDTIDTNNLQIALKHQNIKLIEFLCVNGAKMPKEWLENPNIILPVDIAQTMSSDVMVCLNRCLINRRLRFAAADGNLADVIRCQRQGSDINSMNCYGSTAVLCAIQHGNYFSIVHALVSCGASILHCKDDEPMSLIGIAKSKQYDTIANYLTKELNSQFIASIINDDQKSAEKFGELGVDFNYQDEQKRTALHYAVQYHGIDLVKWLCDRRSLPMSADVNGDYPIMLATEKGIEFLFSLTTLRDICNNYLIEIFKTIYHKMTYIHLTEETLFLFSHF